MSAARWSRGGDPGRTSFPFRTRGTSNGIIDFILSSAASSDALSGEPGWYS